MEPIAFEFSATQNGLYKCEPAGEENGAALYRVRMRWTEDRSPDPVTLQFSLSTPDTYSVFDCRRMDRAKNWGGAPRLYLQPDRRRNAGAANRSGRKAAGV